VKARAEELEKAALDGALPAGTFGVSTVNHPVTRQPQRVCSHVAISSLDHFEKNTNSGTVVLALPRVAAQRIVDGTHRLATLEELAAEQTRQVAQKEEHDRVELILQKKTAVVIRPPKD
jgi:hypothetical protein